ncbi:class I SAM-dependent methyltransferase [Inquilinus limosus]|uniref:class I SAM-dependent methyltransferase n=1 Tax=Inquilinus limosus TaxID=171674 RepID=UPI003F138A9E
MAATHCIPDTRIDNLQKVSDIYDWFDPAVDHIVRQHLKVVPGTSRRTWEFAMIFLALHRAGKLHGTARGLALGAGTERLIFAIAEQVEHVVVTDLYQTDSRWVGVRTDNPQDLVMAHAPWPVPDGRIRAMRMDMRQIELPDDSFDFAWSTGSFEHIGEDEDFIRHLNEVHRVLKPGGVYAFTTVVSYGSESHRIPNNYYFHPEHFADLLHASNLRPEPVFDCAVREHHFNKPSLETLEDFGCAAADAQLHAVVAWRRGTINVANLAVLRKDDALPKVRPEVRGFAETKARLWREADMLTRRLWTDWQELKPHRSGTGYVTGPQYFGSGTVEVEVDAIDRNGSAIELEVLVRRPAPPLGRRVMATLQHDPGDAPLTFQARADHLYALRVARKDGGDAGSVRLRLRRARRSGAQLKPDAATATAA